MTVRMWLTADDVARVSVGRPDPMAEAVFSVIPLRRTDARWGPFTPWRERVAPLLRPGLGPMLAMFPGHPMLDLATVTGRVPTVEEGLDRLLRNPVGVANEVVTLADEHGGLPRLLHDVAHLERGAHRPLAEVVRAYHDLAIAPYWTRLRGVLEAERDRAAGLLAEEGVAGLLDSLGHTGMRWEAPVLEMPSGRGPNAPDRDCHLDGRGVVLAPSIFFGPTAVWFTDSLGLGPELIVYPAGPLLDAEVDLWSAPHDNGPALARLLGHTRAGVLTAVGSGANTTELARRVGTSLPTASEHARALREAGLIRSDRRGGAVVHTLTPLGAQLLDRQG